MENAYAAAIQSVKAHIVNVYELYAVIADNVADAQNDNRALARLVAEFTLVMRDCDGFRHFPEWANADYAMVAEAVAELVEEWEF